MNTSIRVSCGGEDYAIRRFRPEDADGLHAVLSDPLVMRWIEPPYSAERTRGFLQGKGLVNPPAVYALADSEDQIVGQVIFHPYDEDSWELGWIIARSRWGRGLATAVTKALILRCRESGVKYCVIECVPKQTATVRVAEKCGFSPAGQADGLLRYRLAL